MTKSATQFKFGDRVRVTSYKYSCANYGDEGTLVDGGYSVSNTDGVFRFLVRWDVSPEMLWGVHTDIIELVQADS